MGWRIRDVTSSRFPPVSSFLFLFFLSLSLFPLPFHFLHPPFLALTSRLVLARSGITWCTCMHACMQAQWTHACMHACISKRGWLNSRFRPGSLFLSLSPFSLFLFPASFSLSFSPVFPPPRGEEENRSSLKSCSTG